MKTSEIYRTILEFGDVLSNKLSQVVAENSDSIERENAINISNQIRTATSENFGILIDNLMLIEKRQQKEEEKKAKTKTRKTTKRKS